MDKLSAISKKTTTLAGPISLRSNRAATLLAKQIAGGNNETIPEAKNEGENGDGGEAGPSNPMVTCISCALILSDDEVTINLRFIEQAQASGEGSEAASTFPLCVKCLFE